MPQIEQVEQHSFEFKKRGRVKIENGTHYVCIFKKIREKIGDFLDYEITITKDPSRPWYDQEVIVIRPIRKKREEG